MKERKIHKRGNEEVTICLGFTQYENIKTPICIGANKMYNGKGWNYLQVKDWKHVTCKNCLKLKEI